MAAARLRVNVACPDASVRLRAVPALRRILSQWLPRIAPAAARGELCVALVSDRRMRALNRQFRGKDYATDVLAFPSDARGFLGDVVIAGGVAKRQAKEHGHSLKTEVQTLALHGLLHLLGYDHETDDGRMARAEARLRKRAGLPEGLIERKPKRPRTARR
jgi:probable rRNA maturation factor